MERWMIHAYVGPLFTEMKVYRYHELEGGAWKLTGSRETVCQTPTTADNREEQMMAIAIELYAEAAADPWRI